MILHQIREQYGWSQAKLAELSGVSQAAISAIEQRKKQPTLLTLQQLAKAMNVKVAHLIGEIPWEPERKEAGLN